ncbi:reverse transcriptase domain-containing protein, partial [Tanacetum coccineum]
TKTRVTRDSRNQVERQEDKVTKDASNKRKWEGDHDGSSSQQQNKGHKLIECSSCKRVGHLTIDCKVSAFATTQKPLMEKQKTKATCYECGILGHYKSSCPKWKSQNQVNKHGKGKAREDSSVMPYNVNA